jgi:hypothetical protein
MSGVVTKVGVTISDGNWSHRRRDPVAKKTYSKRYGFSLYTDYYFFLFSEQLILNFYGKIGFKK